jgi:hypothetical protein
MPAQRWRQRQLLARTRQGHAADELRAREGVRAGGGHGAIDSVEVETANDRTLKPCNRSKVGGSRAPVTIVKLAALVLASIASVPSASRSSDRPWRQIIERGHVRFAACLGACLVLLRRWQRQHELCHDHKNCFLGPGVIRGFRPRTCFQLRSMLAECITLARI